jgi:hypothetical protein
MHAHGTDTAPSGYPVDAGGVGVIPAQSSEPVGAAGEVEVKEAVECVREAAEDGSGFGPVAVDSMRVEVRTTVLGIRCVLRRHGCRCGVGGEAWSGPVCKREMCDCRD